MICILFLLWCKRKRCGRTPYHPSLLLFVTLFPIQLQNLCVAWLREQYYQGARLSSSLITGYIAGRCALDNLVTMHARDIMGFLLLMLVITEMSRKYMTMQDLARMQAEAERLTKLFELNQALLSTKTQTRKLLAPPAVWEDELPPLCQAPGMECLTGEEVRCEVGQHEGCDCQYIRACFPRASECTFFNSTHITSCGF